MSTSSFRSRFLAVTLAVLGLMLSACSGLSPGDYVVYRLSVGAMSMSAGCFEDGEIPIDVKNDNSDVGAPLTVILHVGPDETYFLDMGETSYAGSAIEGGYRFTGQTIDVNLETGGDMMMDTKKEESEVVTTIEFISIRDRKRLGLPCGSQR